MIAVMKRLGIILAGLTCPLLLPGLALAQETGWNPASAMIKMVGVLALVLAILIGGLWLMRRFAPGATRLAGLSGGIRVLTQHALGQKRLLVVVRVAEQVLLLGVTDHNINFITRIEDEEFLSHSEAPAPENLSSFARLLGRMARPGGKETD